jgi:glycosyltransferase involved in cell wall biosynthesis
MRLGLVIYGELDTLTGGYLYDRQLVEHVQRAGDQIEILSLPWRSYAAHLGDNLSPGLARRLIDSRVDILLEDELNHPSLISANRQVAGTAGIPIVAIVHHLRSSEPWPPALCYLYRTVERAYLRGVDSFVFNSQATRSAVERLASASKPFLLAPPGGDRLGLGLAADAVRTRASQPGPLRILFVGSLIARKGLHVLLDALASLPPETWSLEVIGDLERDGAYRTRIRQQIVRHGLEAFVQLRGAMDDKGLTDAFRRSHVLAVPSAYEGFGIAYLEAMTFGLPVLASAAGGASDVVTDGENGYLIAPGDIAALTGHLGALSRDRGLLSRLGLAARRQALSRPRWADSMESIRQFLLRVGSPGAVSPAISVALGGVR